MIKAVIFDMYETLVTMCQSFSYKGADIAKDLGLPEKVFRQVWDASDDDRTLGKRNFEEVIRQSMDVNNCFSEELLSEIIRKRKDSQREYFNHLHSDIIPMISALRNHGLKVALISNCYLEERDVIKQSQLWKYIDVACLSCEQGIQKPQKEIFDICLEKLGLDAKDCLYIGDGGSNELQKARELGMETAQAAWYLIENSDQPVGRLAEFTQLETPMDVLKVIGE